MGLYKAAIDYSEKALEIYLPKLGNEHRSVGICYNNMGLNYKLLGDLPKALECYQKGLIALEKSCGEKHHLVSICVANIGKIYARQGKYDEAFDLFARTFDIDSGKKLYDSDLNNIGILMKDCIENASSLSENQYLELKKKYDSIKNRYPQYFGELITK